jgi:allantoicase
MADFRDLIDLASERLGGAVLYATDDYFAEKENLLKPSAPVWKEHEYTDRGKWMDGWESRRKRTQGHDFAIIRLGAPGVIKGAVVDTSFFRGNYPEHCSIEACAMRVEDDIDALRSAQWIEVLPKSTLQGDSQNLFDIDSPFAFTHLRLHIYPDGGVARLRIHGEPVPDWHRAGGLENQVDLAAVENGGEVLTCSDMFFGPKHNLIMPGRAHNMSDGWETRRRRGPGHDWVIVKLATEGVVRRIEIDTNHFKGNHPDTASIDASRDGRDWLEILPRTKLQAHTRHVFVDELIGAAPAMHLRLNVYPDGGVSRLRVWGRATERGRAAAATGHLNTRTDDVAQRELLACCGSHEWVRRMLESRPYDDVLAKADEIWSSLTERDWLEAFAAHPRIGDKKPAAKWASEEQSGTAGATAETLKALSDVNRQYEEHFGYIYIVCATGKPADEMLVIARERLINDPKNELRAAAEEQRKITRLRLLKLVS